ncbi:MAG TPA: tetratricopeptide repeat protein [Polyangiaceae bacterium]|nr:tetratricopeptide repeat protein [Polyangiaceae bacterium]
MPRIKQAPATFAVARRHYERGKKQKARQLCEELVLRSPNHAEALALLGALELDAGRPAHAVEMLQRAVKLAPTGDQLCNLGLAYGRLRRFGEATDALARAVQLDSGRAEFIFNLGLVLLDAGDLRNARICLQRASALRPESPSIRRNLAKALARSGPVDEAVQEFQLALSLSRASEADEIGQELLALLEQHERFAEAEATALQLVADSPNVGSTHAALGRALSKQAKYSEAIQSFRQALALDPSLQAVPTQLAHALARSGNTEALLERLAQSTLSFPTLSHHHGSLAYAAAFSPAYGSDELLTLARDWNERHAKALAGKRRPHPHDHSLERRLRVGYVSPDFRNHVLRFIALPVLREHDRSRFDIVCYSSATKPDAWTERFAREAGEWYDVGSLSDAALAEKIRGDRIDVLVDLTMHMGGSRLRTFAEKPSPVRISWCAYPGTTGLDHTHYRITDPYLDPPRAPLPYSETSLWLPHTFWCYDPLTREPPVNELPALASGHVTFGCLNNFMKVHRGVLELWARVLGRVPRSQLLLRAPLGWARSFSLEVLDAAGITSDRVEFVDVQAHEAYLETYHRIDIALDTFPYNGHTTSLDAFWMGVPVTTLVGDTIVGRAGLCQANNLGLPELVAHGSEEFVEIGVGLANDLVRLRALRSGLRQRILDSPLMDAPRFTRDLESLYRKAWQDWVHEAAEVSTR